MAKEWRREKRSLKRSTSDGFLGPSSLARLDVRSGRSLASPSTFIGGPTVRRHILDSISCISKDAGPQFFAARLEQAQRETWRQGCVCLGGWV